MKNLQKNETLQKEKKNLQKRNEKPAKQKWKILTFKRSLFEDSIAASVFVDISIETAMFRLW